MAKILPPSSVEYFDPNSKSYRCCCCLATNGALGIGFVHLVLSISALVFAIVLYFENAKLTLFAIVASVNVAATVVTCGALLIGVQQGRFEFLVLEIAYQIFATVTLGILLILCIVIIVVTDPANLTACRSKLVEFYGLSGETEENRIVINERIAAGATAGICLFGMALLIICLVVMVKSCRYLKHEHAASLDLMED